MQDLLTISLHIVSLPGMEYRDIPSLTIAMDIDYNLKARRQEIPFMV
jgi:hypothetical protein